MTIEATPPSFVSFLADEHLIGDVANVAKGLAAENAENTSWGGDFSGDFARLPCTILNQEDAPYIEVQYRKKKRSLAPEYISAVILLHLKHSAEAYLGTAVERAVITVPNSFNQFQRGATEDAARIAGLDVIRLVNESSAAGVTYVLHKSSPEPRNALIADFGGGMLYVSLVLIEEDILEIIETAGDPRLGGEDFDDRGAASSTILSKKSSRSAIKLREAYERAKCALSLTSETTVEVECLDFKGQLTRKHFELLCGDLFQRVMKPIQRILDSEVNKSAKEDVVLVGGSTRFPRIVELISDLFDGKPLCKIFDPESTEPQSMLPFCVKSLLGIETADGFLPIVKRNRIVPTQGSVLFTFSAANELKVWISDDVPMNDAPSGGETERTLDIKILEGESTQADNTLLSSFEFPS
ncbi:Heat shock cognate 70 [Mycena sanguinolenta]|uniref:Heat shock cognate 70 n=1 Tax=Mycena sanguinolenta TaxID=230812 RepID=A0A8H6Y061_9AGAR|nr:Heat shock cognate 70 [Mycena sanguinolenta]